MKRLPFVFSTLVVLLAWTALFFTGRGPSESAGEAATTTPSAPDAFVMVSGTTGGDLPTPDPNLSPRDVVRLQLEALAQNDRPYADAGIETAFNFASPGHKQVTGTLDRFAEMVKNPIYRDLIGNQHVRYGQVEIEGDVARQAVVLVTEDAYRVGYVFVLSRQEGGAYDGCWLAESVIRFEIDDREAMLAPRPLMRT